MKVEIDRERCVASGSCAMALPAVFDQDEDDGRVILLTAEPDAGLRTAVRDAVLACPGGALSLIEN
ncbi:MAG: ferredoxin [Hamadaea sp.]|nr:ferredoxin [Hamadaea sp.]NUT22025.1 ferredoxin [Hamadaea sp.]